MEGLPLCGRRSCDNPLKNQALALDSSGLFNIVNASICSVSGLPTNELFFEFRKKLEENLSKLQLCCYGGVINVTREMYHDEMDPLHQISSIRRNLPILSDICRDDATNYSEIARLFQSKFHIASSNTPKAEIGILGRAIGSSTELYRTPSSNDVGLIVMALKLSSIRPAVMITDDSNIHRALDIICRERYVAFRTDTFDTKNIHATNSLSYLETPYGCCEVPTKDFFDLYVIIYDFMDELKKTLNPKYLRYERLLNQIMRNVAAFGK